MKAKLVIVFFLLTYLSNAQTDNADVNRFIALFKSQLAALPVGKIEEHFEEGYFKTLSESEYFDKDLEIGLTTIYQRCAGKDEAFSKQAIADYFEQHKRLKKERKEFEAKMVDFNFVRPYLKIRIYSEEVRNLYENHGIVRTGYKGMIEVIVMDLPSGIGSVGRKYLDIWKKTESEIYLLAKENTFKSLDHQFEKADEAKSGEEFYLLASDTDLFVTSFILDLKRANPPAGKYGTLISIPNNMAIVALPLNDKTKIEAFCQSFMGLVDYMYNSQETKPVSNNLFWLRGNEILFIDKDVKNKKFIFPPQLQELIN
jgi:hypothetical protein